MQTSSDVPKMSLTSCPSQQQGWLYGNFAQPRATPAFRFLSSLQQFVSPGEIVCLSRECRIANKKLVLSQSAYTGYKISSFVIWTFSVYQPVSNIYLEGNGRNLAVIDHPFIPQFPLWLINLNVTRHAINTALSLVSLNCSAYSLYRMRGASLVLI